MPPPLPKEVAFAKVQGEVSTEIDYSQRAFRFRRRWFKLRNQATFSTFLPPRFPPDQPWKVFTIGVFEGAAEVWLMQNVLRHPESRLYCVDPWAGTVKLDASWMQDAYRNAVWNLAPWCEQVHLARGYSQAVMGRAVRLGYHEKEPMETFDLVIIDGDHTAGPVYEDARLSLSFLKPGGWMLFDDVRNRVYKPDHVYHGLERFLGDYGDRVELVFQHRYMDCYRKR